jgi:superfamily I DNA/RNA helicase
VAVLGVPCRPARHLTLIYKYLVEPTFHAGCTLLIGASHTLEELSRRPPLDDPDWRCPLTWERLQYLLEQGREPREVPFVPPVNRWLHWWRKLTRRVDGPVGDPGLDPQQNAAVLAGDGVVQVIAPAGSGKTTVLIRRVRELIQRGTPPERILCMSFNRDAKTEIQARLEKAGVQGVIVRSFHGMGLAILKEEGQLRGTIGELDDEVLEQLIAQVAGAAFSVAEAREAVSHFKLAAMVSPEEAMARNGQDRTALVYARYEEELARRGMRDFDDLVAVAVTFLQRSAPVRHRWQQRFERVLVDEYQDIEPAQALLVGLLAAPQDSLFCVGDEDQCIYAWRRATVERIIELDQVYPGLERHALIHNYRCGRRITAASRRLIKHNLVRFRKPLVAGAREKGKIVAVSCPDRRQGAELAAYLISDAPEGSAVVLARTSRLLKELLEAGRRLGYGIPAVEMATIHAAKGREWDRVILYGVDEGQTPHGKSVTGDELEAERRLFYVALTRAKLRLEVICTTGRVSRFLKEAGIRPRPL